MIKKISNIIFGNHLRLLTCNVDVLFLFKHESAGLILISVNIMFIPPG